jgi:hypothetical protein
MLWQAIIFGATNEGWETETQQRHKGLLRLYREKAMDEARRTTQIKRLSELALANALLVSVEPFDDRGPALVVDDPLDASAVSVRMPASPALALLGLLEGEPVPST